MKLPVVSGKGAGVDRVLRIFRWFPWGAPDEATLERVLNVTEVHALYAQFVFRSLQQLGGHPADLDDLRQEVFIVVHHKLPTYDPERSMKGWLFRICKNVVGNYRKKRARRRETMPDEMPDPSSDGVELNPEELLSNARARKVLAELLDELDLDKRAVFVMFEIDQMSCEEIAAAIDIPIGTVHSRLHKAREKFEAAVARRKARMAKGGRR